MLCSLIDLLITQLLVQCNSYTLISSLHVQAASLINYITYRMLQFGNNHLLPNQSIPAIVPVSEHEVAEISLQSSNPNDP